VGGPAVAVSGAGAVNAGATYALTLGAVTDPGTDTVSRYVVHWGDGTSDTYTTGGAKTHVYATGATQYAVAVDLLDEDGMYLDRANSPSGKVNAAPTGVALSNSAIAENQPSGTTVGSFSTTDADAGDTFTYTLVRGDDYDYASFTIDASGNLLTAASFDFEAKSSYSIRVRSTDAGGLSTEKVFTVSVTNVNEAPTLAVPAAQTAFEDVDKAVAGITVGDPEGDRLTVTLKVSHGTLTLGTTTGLTVTGIGSGAVPLAGSIADLNTALAGLVYRGGLNYSGSDTLSISVSDGSLSTKGSVAITVVSAHDQAVALQAKVKALYPSVLNGGQANALLVKLTLNGTAGDIDKVQGFLDQVRDFVRDGILSQDQANALLGPGNTLLLSVTRR
jgi:VCBS repeat-containing protein